MSSMSYSHDCPYCNGTDTVYACTTSRPYEMNDGVCVECGFSYETVERQLNLDEVNSERKMLDLKPLKRLKKQERS
jgi:transcription elongation factor Elf1